MHHTDDATNYVCECNRAFNAETRHPLVGLIDMSAPCGRDRIRTDCYGIVLRHRAADGAEYGRRPSERAFMMALFVASIFLAITPLEFFHEHRKRCCIFHRKCIVKTCAQSSNRPVPL